MGLRKPIDRGEERVAPAPGRSRALGDAGKADLFLPAGEGDAGEDRVVALVRDPQGTVPEEEGARPELLCHRLGHPVLDRIPEDVLLATKAALAADESVQAKPEAIREKIVEGQLAKWYKEVCLLEQPFRDEDRSVRDLVTEKIATIGENIRVRRFVRYALGEEM